MRLDQQAKAMINWEWRLEVRTWVWEYEMGDEKVLYHTIADGSDPKTDRLKSFNEPIGNKHEIYDQSGNRHRC